MEGLITGRDRKSGADFLQHAGGSGDDRWSESLMSRQVGDDGAGNEITDSLANDLLTLLAARDREFKNEIESPEDRWIHLLDRVGQPDHWDRVFFEETIDPKLMINCRFRGMSGLLEEVLSFIAHDERGFIF